jgi:hypothetical protein
VRARYARADRRSRQAGDPLDPRARHAGRLVWLALASILLRAVALRSFRLATGDESDDRLARCGSGDRRAPRDESNAVVAP